MRLPTVPTPCFKCPKIPQGVERVATNAIEPSDRSWQAYQHYRECRAVGAFPNDAICRRNAAIIRAVEDSYERSDLRRLIDILSTSTR